MGLYKNIGDGKSTFVWRDPWIPGVHAGGLNPLNDVAVNYVRVCDLFNEEGRCWNRQTLDEVFDRSTVEKILCIPLNRVQQPDRWSWKGEADGTFSVKSCYKLAMKECWENSDLTPDHFCEVPTAFWKSVWKLPILSRYKVLFWRAYIGVIPTIEALGKRGIHIDEPCVFCGVEQENVYHTLIECNTLQQFWQEAKFDFSSWSYHQSLLEWMSVEWSSWVREQRRFFIMALYFIWDTRNRCKFANEPINLNGLWVRVERQWDELCVASNGAVMDVVVPASLRWEKPATDFMKMNVDAALKNTGEGALGGVLRDCEGMVHGVFMVSTPVLNDTILLEAMAVKKGVEFVRDAGVAKVIVECDSRLVVDMLNAGCNHSSLLSSVCTSILHMCNGFDDISFRWIPRTSNQCANRLSKAARDVIGEMIWRESMPICISELCIDDLHQ
ncbi:uncharacterized protein G2W53_038547 [Senna tora]|uniref:Uncharacterized protein n=1 Tax=Senna tora TaxID=362788 RepID=A0A834SMS6_9FABA|nr:uncharacterized protein G2W53_038547 [Senna tora]